MMKKTIANVRSIPSPALLPGLLICFFLVSCSSGNSSGGLGVYPKAMGAADEGSTMQAWRTIASAEAQMKVTRGSYGDFDALTQAGYLDQRFAGSTPNLRGYRFIISAGDSEFGVQDDPPAT